jgi:hypothetical protein
MTEVAMTLVELMIERTPPTVVGADPKRWAVDRSWWGWLTGAFSWMEGQRDWHRKI